VPAWLQPGPVALAWPSWTAARGTEIQPLPAPTPARAHPHEIAAVLARQDTGRVYGTLDEPLAIEE